MLSQLRDRLVVLATGLALLIAGYLAPNPPVPPPLAMAALVLGGVLSAWGLAELVLGLARGGAWRLADWRLRPRLVLTPTPAETWAVRPTSDLADFVQIRVSNTATRPQGDAVKVFGHLRVHRPTGPPLDLPARCAASDGYPSDGTEERTEIAAGLSRAFNVAVRFHGESDAYIVNSEGFTRHGARKPEWRLPPGTYEVEFRVSHERGSERQTFVLRNPTNGPLELIPRRTRESGQSPAAPKPARTSEPTTGPASISTTDRAVVSQAQIPDDLGPVITVVDPDVRGLDQPPEAWTAPFWQGKPILKCPWDDFRTISEQSFLAHRDIHTEPPTDAKAQEVSTMPWPWAKTPFHYLGDGSHYFPGVPADPDHTLYAPAKRAEELVATGLYGEGPVDTQEHAFSGAVGRTIVCKCGHEAGTMAEFQSHLSETG